ncbi:hypothetical protein CRENBAI_010266 [Crenichthys baileyi]|uniref:Uncharacterized protein n=1 Tax=Crenichthys baileyi TaxID=28760 RepID=A0AAV9QWG9_9TELE
MRHFLSRSEAGKLVPVLLVHAGGTSHPSRASPDAAGFQQVWRRSGWISVVSDPVLREMLLVENRKVATLLSEYEATVSVGRLLETGLISSKETCCCLSQPI